jgi:hypothetical protein
MSVWQVDSIHKRPTVTLSEWAVVEVPLAGPHKPWTRHLAGWSCEGREAQVCSPVVMFDPSTATCATEAGSVYRLEGVPGLCPDGEYTLNAWLGMRGITALRDVTTEVFLAIQDAADKARRVH